MLHFEHDYYAKDKERRKNVISWFIYIVLLTMFLSTLPDIYFRLWHSAAAMLVPMAYFLGINILNHKGHTDKAAHLLLFGCNFFLLVFSCMIGSAANVHFLLIVSILFIPFMINTKHKPYVFFHIATSMSFLVLLELTNFSIFPQFPDISHEQRVIFGKVNVILMFFLLPYLVFAIINAHTTLANDLIASEKLLRQQNEELSKINAELDSFVYRVSHDLRSPIASVLGLINLSMNETDLVKLREYEQLKAKSLNRLDNFIRDILDYSRNARLELQPQTIKWQSFLEQLFTLYEHLPESATVQVKIDIEQNTDFRTDLYRLAIIFNNLFTNAIRYQDINKPQSTIEITGKVSKEKAVISFKDNGIGIAEEHHTKIFDMFYRANQHSKGSGLGLYILKEALYKLNGNLQLNSTLGKGTEFVMEFPNNIQSD